MQAILGQRLSSDLNLVAQILILLGLWIGFLLARRKRITQHRAVQTTMVLVNLFFILFVMITSFYSYVIAGGTVTGTVAQLMMVHGFLGLVAELTGVYLILRMTTHLIPPRLRVRNFRLVMRSVLGLWTLLVLLGFGIYYARYLAPSPTAVASPVALLVQAADDIQVHAEEMATAAGRGSLATGKRHAEHVINLIEGKAGADYGDIDRDGLVEDPGDGTGALVYLERSRAAAQTGDQATRAGETAGQIRDAMIKIVADAKAFVGTNDLSRTSGVIREITTLATQVRDAPTGSVAQLAQILRGVPAQPALAGASVPAAENGVTVVMQNFAFSPKSLRIKKGTTVTWVNQDRAKHTVTADDGKFDSGDMPSGQTFAHKFDEVGTFPYYCLYHGDKGGVDMAGTVVVEP
jgi:plastocyanin/uncharacterized membrane protein YozB (DUF420 family)